MHAGTYLHINSREISTRGQVCSGQGSCAEMHQDNRRKAFQKEKKRSGKGNPVIRSACQRDDAPFSFLFLQPPFLYRMLAGSAGAAFYRPIIQGRCFCFQFHICVGVWKEGKVPPPTLPQGREKCLQSPAGALRPRDAIVSFTTHGDMMPGKWAWPLVPIQGADQTHPGPGTLQGLDEWLVGWLVKKYLPLHPASKLTSC